MVSSKVYDYLKENYGVYGTSELKKSILEMGYSEADFSEALGAVKAKKRSGRKIRFSRESSFPWILVGFIAGMILCVYSISILTFSLFPEANFIPSNEFVFILIGGLFLFSAFFYFFAFFKIGGLCEESLLKFFSLFLIVFYLLLAVGLSVLFALFYSYLSGVLSDFSLVSNISGMAISQIPSSGNLEMFGGGFLGFFISMIAYSIVELIKSLPFGIKLFFIIDSILLFCFLISYFVFSVGLIRSRKNVRLFLYAGIFRFFFSFVCLISFVYFYYLVFRIIFSPEYLVRFVGLWPSVSSYLGVMVFVILFLNLVSFILESIGLYLGHEAFE